MGRYSSLGWAIAIGVVAVLLAPVVVLVGEPVRNRHQRGWHRMQNRQIRYELRGRGRGALFGAQFQMHLLMMQITRNAVVIALTAPGRWVGDRMRSMRGGRMMRKQARMMRMGPGCEGLFPDDPPFLSGVREPRRPSPAPPSDAVALEPPNEHTGTGVN
ncbi:MAG: hypothetical protein ACRDVE_11905 [Actinocrinis sp.]